MPKRIYDWATIQCFHEAGHGFVECQKKFGFTHSAWIKAIRRGELRKIQTQSFDTRKRYNWIEIQAYYDEGHSTRDCMNHFGFTAAAWEKARKRGEIQARRNQGMPIDKLLTGPRGRTHLKGRLLRAGLLQNRCNECGLTEWRGRPLNAHIDHINGIKDDHRLENLRMLCPNCHSQTNTYGGRNLKRRRALQEPNGAV